jgi:hypothetical protein
VLTCHLRERAVHQRRIIALPRCSHDCEQSTKSQKLTAGNSYWSTVSMFSKHLIRHFLIRVSNSPLNHKWRDLTRGGHEQHGIWALRNCRTSDLQFRPGTASDGDLRQKFVMRTTVLRLHHAVQRKGLVPTQIAPDLWRTGCCVCPLPGGLNPTSEAQHINAENDGSLCRGESLPPVRRGSGFHHGPKCGEEPRKVSYTVIDEIDQLIQLNQ